MIATLQTISYPFEATTKFSIASSASYCGHTFSLSVVTAKRSVASCNRLLQLSAHPDKLAKVCMLHYTGGEMQLKIELYC